MLTQDQIEKLETALNDTLPNGYDDFDDFADAVMAIDIEPDGREWTISPYHTGQRQNPNDWDSPMVIGVEIELPHLNAVAIYDGWNWSVEAS